MDRLRTSWTPEDDARLYELKRQGLTYREIASRLGRSEGAVASHLSELKTGKAVFGAARSRFDPWRVEEDLELCRAYLPNGPTIAEVAERIGRSVGACRMRAKSLGFTASKSGPQRKHELAGSRRCHDCGRPTNDFRCYRCRIAWREKHGVQRDATEEEGL